MQDILEKVQRAIDTEISSIQHFRQSMDNRIADAVRLILNATGKVIVTGVGKSGDIAKKISSTMTSTGTPAVCLHPTDAAHGDAGIISSDDVVIAIGKSGESDELIFLIPTIKKIGAKLIGITANPESKLALACDIVILTPVLKEACPLELAPTSSTTIALIVGDAIAMALMELKSFQADDFALYHPSGRLGKRLSLNIEDVMRKKEENAFVYLNDTLDKILNEITGKRIGAVAVIDEDQNLKGLITDYDIRKLLTKAELTPEKKAFEIMNPSPSFFKVNQKAYDVLLEMENSKRPFSVAPIIDTEGKLAGMISIHDLLQKGLK